MSQPKPLPPAVVDDDDDANDVFTSTADDAADLPHISEREDITGHEELLKQNVTVTGPSPAQRRASRRLSVTLTPRSAAAADGDDDAPPPTPGSLMRVRSNSTSTLYVANTVSQPGLESTLRCVALALHYMIEDGHAQENPQLMARHFDERNYPLEAGPVPADYATRLPTTEAIYALLHKLFTAAALNPECAIVALVYINRLIAYTHLALHASNWKRIALGAVLMASKVWDDQAVWNVDFCTILPRIAVEDMNDLERVLLEMLRFNINVDSSVYTKYYFELRDLALESQQSFPLEPLTKDKATKLEVHSW